MFKTHIFLLRPFLHFGVLLEEVRKKEIKHELSEMISRTVLFLTPYFCLVFTKVVLLVPACMDHSPTAASVHFSVVAQHAQWLNCALFVRECLREWLMLLSNFQILTRQRNSRCAVSREQVSSSTQDQTSQRRDYSAILVSSPVFKLDSSKMWLWSASL